MFGAQICVLWLLTNVLWLKKPKWLMNLADFDAIKWFSGTLADFDAEKWFLGTSI